MIFIINKEGIQKLSLNSLKPNLIKVIGLIL
jgi:hypothetical protein